MGGIYGQGAGQRDTQEVEAAKSSVFPFPEWPQWHSAIVHRPLTGVEPQENHVGRGPCKRKVLGTECCVSLKFLC